MNFNNIKNLKIVRSAKVRITDRKILLEECITNKPIFSNYEIIAFLEKATDKRKYSNLTIFVEPGASQIINFEYLKNRILKALDNGEFENMGNNEFLYYGSLTKNGQPINQVII